MDETYVKVNGRWAYLYQAVDSRGRTVDFYISTDKAPAYGRALALLKREGRCPSDVEHRQKSTGTT